MSKSAHRSSDLRSGYLKQIKVAHVFCDSMNYSFLEHELKYGYSAGFKGAVTVLAKLS